MAYQSLINFISRAKNVTPEIIEHFKEINDHYLCSTAVYSDRAHLIFKDKLIGSKYVEGHIVVFEDNLYLSNNVTPGSSLWREDIKAVILDIFYSISETSEIKIDKLRNGRRVTEEIAKQIVEALKQHRINEALKKLPSEEIKKIVFSYDSNGNAPRKTKRTVETYYRDEFLKELAKRIANGICQLCESQAPFLDRDNRPFLEVHHVEWLSRGGVDGIENVVALCPNCHRKMHILDDKEEFKKLKKIAMGNFQLIRH